MMIDILASSIYSVYLYLSTSLLIFVDRYIPGVYRCLTKNTSALVEITVSRPLCLTTFIESKDLGRFLLRSQGESIAVGIIVELG